MRDIRFRGMTPQGKWLFGFLVKNEDGRYAVVPELNDKPTDFSQYEVEKETIGQYTEMNDRRNRRIYDGDIVEFYGERTVKAVVMMDKGEWIVRAIKDNIYQGLYGNYPRYMGVVIGNIYEDKELI